MLTQSLVSIINCYMYSIHRQLFSLFHHNVDGFIDKAVVQEAEYKVRDLEQLVSSEYTVS